MSIVFVTGDLNGVGGVQLFSRLALSAIEESFGNTHSITAISRFGTCDQSQPTTSNRHFANGSALQFVSRLRKELRAEPCQALIIMHLNLVRALPILPRCPTATVLHGIEVWRNSARLPELVVNELIA